MVSVFGVEHNQSCINTLQIFPSSISASERYDTSSYTNIQKTLSTPRQVETGCSSLGGETDSRGMWCHLLLQTLINLLQECVAYNFMTGESALLYFTLLQFSMPLTPDLPAAKVFILLYLYLSGLFFLPWQRQHYSQWFALCSSAWPSLPTIVATYFSYLLLFCPEAGSSRFLWNTGKYVPASHRKRQ